MNYTKELIGWLTMRWNFSSVPTGARERNGQLDFGKLIFMKIIEIADTRLDILKLKRTKFDFGWGFDPDSAGSSGGASFFEWGGRRGEDILGGESIWLPITHFHNTGHIVYYSKFPTLSLDLSFLFASCDFFPFHLSFPSPAPPPPLIQLGVWGAL